MISGKYIGVMSGTSLDAVDAVMVEITPSSVIQKVSFSYPMPPDIKQDILAICQGQPTTLSQIGQLDLRLGILFAEAVLGLLNQYQIHYADILAIGNHGQTVRHQPTGQYPFTMQLGDNNRVAAMTQITTIGDFRRKDMAFGGQGAPLVPAFHQAMLAVPHERRMILNIGGIANLSLLIPDTEVCGFDTGPGNILMDAWIDRHQGKGFDRDALWARQGNVNFPLLSVMLSDPYFDLPSPKSTGREHFNLQWIYQQLELFGQIAPQDIQATLAELTAVSIANHVIGAGECDRLLVCGGGGRNPLLMERLTQLLPNSAIDTTDNYGIRSDDMEAIAFAWLAARTLAGLPGNIPSVTGASRHTVLGAVYTP